MKTKVLVMGIGSGIGGVENIVLNLYRNIDKEKVRFDFLLNCKVLFEDELISNGSNIYRYTMLSKNPVKYYYDLKKFFKSHTEYDYVWAQQSYPKSIAACKFIKKHTNAKLINHCHTTGLSKKGRFIYDALTEITTKINRKRLTRLVDYMFACSIEAGVWLYGSDNKDKVVVINNGIDTSEYQFSVRNREKIRSELKIDDKFVIGFTGRFAEAKNLYFLLEIFNEVHNADNEAVLLLVGDGELRDGIVNKAKDLKLENNVIITGMQSGVADYLCAMDVFAFPSLYEGFGIVLIEAQANGLHCVASDTVPNSTEITELVEYISLQKPASFWAERILSYSTGYERKSMKDEVDKAGFNIEKVAKNFEIFLTEGKLW